MSIQLTPIEPIAKIEPVDQPKEVREIAPPVLSLLEEADQLELREIL